MRGVDDSVLVTVALGEKPGFRYFIDWNLSVMRAYPCARLMWGSSFTREDAEDYIGSMRDVPGFVRGHIFDGSDRDDVIRALCLAWDTKVKAFEPFLESPEYRKAEAFFRKSPKASG